MPFATLASHLKQLHATNVLDVATGSGFFAELLKENLHSWQSITGIDQKPFNEKTQPVFTLPGLTYRQMSADRLDFSDGCFDLVALSNSIHHFEFPQPVLQEMNRVLRLAGNFVIFEMYNDNQNPAQANAVRLHQWWGKINTAGGIYHNPHYNRADIVTLLKSALPAKWEYCDILPEDEDPFDAEAMQEIDENIAQNLKTCAALKNAKELSAEGEQCRAAIHQNGFQSATELLAIGTKR